MKIFIRYVSMAAIALAAAFNAGAQTYVAPPVKISEQKVKIDGKVYFRSAKRIAPGSFVQVKIREVLDYDLMGRAILNDE